MSLKWVVFGICFLSPLTSIGQVPPGAPYDPEAHPNPIVTFVTTADFGEATWEDAREKAGLDLLGLPGDLLSAEEIALAPENSLEVRVLGRRTQVLTFPVVRQTFHLNDGGTALLYSFRNPRTDLPSADAGAMLDTDALTPPREAGEGRFGPVPLPEEATVRGRPALLFPGGNWPVIFWQDGRISYVVVADLDLEDLFVLVEDLL